MILEKYDFDSVHEFLSELVNEINSKGEAHLTTILMDTSTTTISVMGNNKGIMTSTLNYALKHLIATNVKAGNEPDMAAIATVIRSDMQKKYPSREDIEEDKDSIEEGLQELLNLFRTNH